MHGFTGTNELTSMTAAGLRAALSRATPEEAEGVADALRRLAGSPAAHALDLAELRAVMPWLHRSDVALDAAVDLCLRSAERRGEPIDALAGRLMGEHPDVALQIQRAVLLHLALATDGSVGGSGGGGCAPLALPAWVGEPGPGGRPRYELLSYIGGGAQGGVYEGVDRVLSEPERPAIVAVKVAHAPAGPEHLDRRRDEATRTRRIDHPAVVRVFDRGVTPDGRAFTVLERVKGLPLDTWVANQASPPTPSAAALLVVEIGQGVQAAHSAGLVHLDIKPSNVLIDHRGRARVMDFGVARDSTLLLDHARRYSTRGSLAFMAPERFAREGGSDTPLADVYALGGLLYWLLTGRFPNGQSVSEAIERLERRAPAPSARPLRPGVSTALDRVCARALSPNPLERHGSVQALCDDLRAVVAHRAIPWQSPSPARRGVLLFRRRPRAVAAGAAGVGVALLATALLVRAEGLAALREAREAAELEQLTADLQRTRERADDHEERIRSSFDLVNTWLTLLKDQPMTNAGLWVAFVDNIHRMDVFEGQSLLEMTREAQIRMAHMVLDELRATGAEGSMEAAVWSDLLGTWCAEAGQASEARRHLLHARRVLGPRLDPSDPWVTSLDAKLAALDSGGPVSTGL